MSGDHLLALDQHGHVKRAADGFIAHRDDGGATLSSGVSTRPDGNQAVAGRVEGHPRPAFQAVVPGVIILDEAGVIRHADTGACQILGLSVDHLRGRLVSDLPWYVHGDATSCPGEMHPAMVALRTRRPVYDVVLDVNRPSRGIQPLLIAAEPLVDPETGALQHVVVTLCDGAEPTQNKTMLDIVEAMPDPVVIVDPAGLIVLANLQTETVFGYNRHELQGLPVDALLPEQLRSSHARARAHYATHPYTRSMGGGLQLAGRRKNGDEFPVEVSLNPIQTEQETLVVCLIRDTTNRKRMEDALRENEERFRALVQNSSDIITILDADGITRYTSASSERVLGNDSAAWIGKNAFGNVHPDDLPSVHRAFRQLLHQPGTTVSLEYRYHHANGTWAYLESIARNYLDDPRIKGIVVNTRDVTERKKEENERQQTTRQLEKALGELQMAQRQAIKQERLHALGEMASGIAHDFNNALAPIVGYIDLLLEVHPEDIQDPSKVRIYLEWMRTAADHATSVVRRLREFYRERAGGADFAPVDLSRLVEQVLALTEPRWKDQAFAKGVVVQVRSDLSEVAHARGSEAELREVLVNLIFNAVEAMPNGGQLSIRTFADSDAVVLEVSDTGVGMTEEVRQHCLEPFFTTKGTDGTGLGLSIVNRMIQRHQGTLNIASSPGQGTTIRIRLPIWSPDQDNREPTVDRVPRPPRPRRILVVDDEPSLRVILTEYLTMDGHAVETATNGRDGLEKFDKSAFDLVMTDHGMPDMSGNQLAAAIKQRAPSTPVVLVTGFGDLMNAAGERPEGVDLVVGKPVTIQALRNAILMVTDQSAATLSSRPATDADLASGGSPASGKEGASS